MTRSQRKCHLVIWTLLAPVLAAALALALAARPPAPRAIPADTERSSR